MIITNEQAATWLPISTFDNRMFSLMSDGTPEGTEVVKYKGEVPDWAKWWMPLPILPAG